MYLGDLVVFRVDSESTTAHFYATDLSNNVRLVWSFAVKGSKLTVEGKFRYKPFGEAATPLVTPTSDPRFKYASQDLSQATKLYHMGARYYAPDLGRFTSRDPVGGHGYAYARDDPMALWDPSGLDSQGIDWAAVGAFVAGAVVMGACIALTAGVCGGVIVAFVLAGIAGAATAAVITAAEGRPITLNTVAGGALMGVFGASFIYGLAGAGALGPDMATSLFEGSWGASASVSAGEGLGAGAAGLVGEEEDITDDLDANLPQPGQQPGTTSTGMADGGEVTSVQSQIDYTTPANDEETLNQPFTKYNFRENLIRRTGVSPGSEFEAHHVLPQEFEKELNELFDGKESIHDPRFGAWVSADEHAQFSYEYNAAWGTFLEQPHTANEVLEFARGLAEEYDFDIQF